MTKIRCDICHDSRSLDHFRFLCCGHGFCKPCIEKTRKQRVCAVCRSPKGSGEPRQIFVTFVETERTTEERARTIADGLNTIDATAPATSLEKAGRKIKEIARHVDEEIAHELLEAAHNLEERMVPLLLELELEKAQRIALEEQVQVLERKLKDAEPMEKQVTRLQRKLREEKQKYDATAAMAKEARKQAFHQMDEIIRLNERVQRQQRGLEGKDEEIQQAQNEVAEQEKKIGLLTRKLRALSKLDKRLKFRPQDPDESLQIEPLVPTKAAVHNGRLTESQHDSRVTLEQIDNLNYPPPKRRKVR